MEKTVRRIEGIYEFEDLFVSMKEGEFEIIEVDLAGDSYQRMMTQVRVARSFGYDIVTKPLRKGEYYIEMVKAGDEKRYRNRCKKVRGEKEQV